MMQFLFIFGIIGLLVLGPIEDEPKIVWADTLTFNWTLFKAAVPANKEFHARTDWGIDCSAAVMRGNLVITLTAVMYPNASWIKPTKKSEELLIHEKLHFDIAEVYARKIRQAFEDSALNKTDVDVWIKGIYRKIFEDCRNAQKQFDEDTNHSIVKAEQIKWFKKVNDALEQLDRWKQVTVKKSME